MPRPRVVTADPQYAEDEHLEIHPSGSHAAGDFRCASCGYGIVFRGPLPHCPICRGSAWQESAWRPFSRGRTIMTKAVIR